MAEIETTNLGLFIPAIDDRSEEDLYAGALNVVLNRSQGSLNDTSPHNPLGVLLRSQAFASAELLFRVNKLPLSLLVKFLEITGVERRLGAKAQVTLTFTLTAPRNTPFTISAGFEVTNNSGAYSFFTDTVLTIPAGSSSGTVTATAAEQGENYNLPAYTINQITQPLAFLAGVINTEPAQGGDEDESIESAIIRGLKALRRRNLVSALDFREAAEEVMGAGSRAQAIGLLGPDRVTEQLGAVHVFCLDASGQPANQALLDDVRRDLRQSLMLGTSLYTSPMELLEIEGDITAKLLAEVDPIKVADNLWNAYQNYLAPAAYEPGRTLQIQELRHALRFVGGLEFIEELQLNGSLQDVPMPNEFTLPSAYNLVVNLVDIDGNITSVARGAGEPPTFQSPA